MEIRYQRTGNENIKWERNLLILEILVYISAILVLFGLGGYISKLATEPVVQLISADGVVKIAAIISMLIIIYTIFYGWLRILTHADYYCYLIKN